MAEDPISDREVAPPSADSSRRRALPAASMSLEIARIDLRRGYRWIREQDFWMVFTAVMVVMSAFFLWVTFRAARNAGAAMANGEGMPTWIVMGASVVWLFCTVLLAGGAAGTGGDLDNGGYYLTLRPVADVASGMLTAATCKFSVYTLGPGVAAGLGLAAGTGSIRPPIGTLAAAVVAVVTAAAVGYPLGFAAKGVVRRSRGLDSVTTVLTVVLGTAYVVLSVTGGLLTVIETLRPVLVAPPLAWIADLALVTTPGADSSTAEAAGALALGAVVTPLGVVLSGPAARYAWTADTAPTSDAETETPAAPNHRIDSLLGVVCRAQATRGVASTVVVRAVRSPFQFVFVAPPLVGAILLAEALWATGSLPWFAPWFVVWYGAWIAGAVVPLNPLGNQGTTLPTLLTAPAEGEHVVHGHVVATALPLAPLTAALAVGAGVVAASSAVELAALTLASVGAVVGGAVLAAGLGTVFPRFEAIDFSGARRAVPPSKLAYALFSTLMTVLVVPAAVVADDTARDVTALLLSERLPFGVTVGTEAVTAISWAVLAAGVVAVPLAYRTAVRRLNAYRLA